IKPDIPASMGHLLDTVGVEAVLGALASSDLAAAFDETTKREKKVFVLNPFQADSSLLSIKDDGRLWHILGPYTDLVPAYASLIGKVAKLVRSDASIGASAPLKIALVDTRNVTFSSDIASLLPGAILVDNGVPINAQQNQGYYLHVTT